MQAAAKVTPQAAAAIQYFSTTTALADDTNPSLRTYFDNFEGRLYVH